ncbi:hypothetical protein BDQ12DRAFT_732366 [Crucibulum laeve]|uniref:Uncharacterized protein n=1 Tax=Crucibulum laeve TaxID=68775 RepID=A0A5C3MBP5_9AGAR|nr:hypothetical protein BDQ12DRAFT_732366 [Crucibulum laeve]
MSRLASFKGPSTPSASPAQYKPQNSPASPSRQTESTFHRKTRTYLQELRSITDTWDDLVLIDGLKAARSLVDARTDLNNALALIPDRLPRTHIVGPKIELMERCIIELDAVVSKLQKQFRRINVTIDNLEAVLVEAHKIKGWKWVYEEPLWVTWSLEKFVTSVPEIIIPYHRSLNLHMELVNTLRSHSVSFEDSRDAVSKWVEQPWLEDSGWDVKWEDICAAEVERWDKGR